MKKIILFFILTGIYFLTAVEISFEDAIQVADSFREDYLSDREVVNVLSYRQEGNEIFYNVQLAPEGFIIVNSDNDLPPVLAYSRFGNLNDPENPLWDIMDFDMQKRRAYYKINPQAAITNNLQWDSVLLGNHRQRDFQQWPPEGSTQTDGWVEKTWNQSGVYNRFCPLDNSGERSVVGCTATAMSMIMDFHEWIGDPVFTNSDDYYTWSEGMYIDNDHESRDYPDFPELNIYLDDVVDHYANGFPLTSDDKSALCFAAGVSVEMDYSSTGSGAWGVVWPLLNKFGYDSATEIEGNAWDFYDIMIDNMKHMRPGEMAIYSETSGHAIIVDGYNTDDYYHLNYGWGTSNSTCWYTLPNGMPSGYTIISSCVLNIEGGDVPVEVTGSVSVAGYSGESTEINLYGEKYSYQALADEVGSFEFPAVLEGIYTVEAIFEDRIYYYCEDNVQIDEGNTNLTINLGNFDQFTGNVAAPVAVTNAEVRLYQNDDLIYNGFANESGYFSISDVLPGVYRATASVSGNYYQESQLEVTLEDQSADFTLEHYPGELARSFASTSTDIWSLVPGFTLGCAIKLTGEELVDNEDDIISQIRFKAPFGSDTGTLKGQIWEGELLIAEIPIAEFDQGDWIQCDPGNYILVNPNKEYYVGYEAYSETGQFAWHDDTPRIPERGAYFNHSGWTELQPDNFDFNFTIEALLGSQQYGSINGNIEINSEIRTMADVIIKAGDYVTHPTEDGNFSLPLKYGNYDLQAFYLDEVSNIIEGIEITSQNPEVNGCELAIFIQNEAEEDLPAVQGFCKSYPNPFSYSNSNRAGITIEFNPGEISSEQQSVSIYNVRGQIVNTLICDKADENGIYRISWDGRDRQGKQLSSGIYFSRIKNSAVKSGKFIIVK